MLKFWIRKLNRNNRLLKFINLKYWRDVKLESYLYAIYWSYNLANNFFDY